LAAKWKQTADCVYGKNSLVETGVYGSAHIWLLEDLEGAVQWNSPNLAFMEGRFMQDFALLFIETKSSLHLFVVSLADRL
jgi:hypothetical protein